MYRLGSEDRRYKEERIKQSASGGWWVLALGVSRGKLEMVILLWDFCSICFCFFAFVCVCVCVFFFFSHFAVFF